MEEKEIWKGSPSQWINFKVYLLCFLFCWLVVPIFIALWKFLAVKTWKIELTDQRLIEEKGVLSRTTESLELYRVKDITLEQPFFLRIMKLSNIVMLTSDKTHQIAIIPAIRDGKEVYEQIRTAVDIRRDLKRVRETDFE